MRPKAPLPPNPADEQWKLLFEKKPNLSIEAIDQIAELSAQYLQPDAAEFSEDDLLSNLRLLWELSHAKQPKIAHTRAKQIEKLVISAFSAFGKDKSHGQRHEHHESPGRIARVFGHLKEKFSHAAESPIASDTAAKEPQKAPPGEREKREKAIMKFFEKHGKKDIFSRNFFLGNNRNELYSRLDSLETFVRKIGKRAAADYFSEMKNETGMWRLTDKRLTESRGAMEWAKPQRRNYKRLQGYCYPMLGYFHAIATTGDLETLASEKIVGNKSVWNFATSLEYRGKGSSFDYFFAISETKNISALTAPALFAASGSIEQSYAIPKGHYFLLLGKTGDAALFTDPKLFEFCEFLNAKVFGLSENRILDFLLAVSKTRDLDALTGSPVRRLLVGGTHQVRANYLPAIAKSGDLQLTREYFIDFALENYRACCKLPLKLLLRESCLRLL
jgi:hypothetical protein